MGGIDYQIRQNKQHNCGAETSEEEDGCVSQCANKGLFGFRRVARARMTNEQQSIAWSRSGGTGGSEGWVAGPGVRARKKKRKGGVAVAVAEEKGESGGKVRFQNNGGSGDLDEESFFSCACGA